MPLAALVSCIYSETRLSLQSFLDVLPATVMQARVEGDGGAQLKKKKGKGGKFDEAAFLKELQETAVEFSTQPVVDRDTRVKRQFLIFSATLVHVDYTRLFKSGAKGTFARGDGIAMTDEESKSSSFERCDRLLSLCFGSFLFSCRRSD
jgi:hypothetical protein